MRGAALGFLLLHVLTAGFFLINRASGTDAALTGFPLDDSWIHQVYARSLAQFEGFSYSGGQASTGATSPLWPLAMAPLHWIKGLWGGDVVFGVKALGIALGWLNSVALFQLISKISGSRVSGFLAGVLVALDPRLTFSCLSGMEVLLSSLLVLVFFSGLVQRELLRVSLAMMLVPFARPEMGVALIPGAAALGYVLVRERASFRVWARLFSPALVVLAGWMGRNAWWSGRPLPATFYVKHHAGSGMFDGANLETILRMILELPWMYLGSGVVLTFAGVYMLVQRGRREQDLLRRWTIWAFVCFPFLFVYTESITVRFLQPWPYYWHRYLEPVLPFLLGLIAIPAGAAWEAIRHRGATRRRGSARVKLAGNAVLVLLLLVPLVVYPRKLGEAADLYGNNCENINEVQVTLGKWVHEHTDEDALIATTDAGAIRFFGKRDVIDMVGLNTPEMALADRSGKLDLLRQREPDYLITHSEWFWVLNGLGARHEIRFSAKAKDYTICNCPSLDHFFVYELDWSGSRSRNFSNPAR